MTYHYLVGIDEAGRGPLAGPITLAALAFPKKFRLPKTPFKIKDSKKMMEKNRNEMYKILKGLKKAEKIHFSVSHIKHSLIDKNGLSWCIKRGIERCLKKLELQPGLARILLDGSLYAPDEYKNQKTIIKGDEKVKIIALASIIAKVYRDRCLCRLAKKYPEYGLEIHKGYGTKSHRKSLKKHGPSEIHRKSFIKMLV